MRVALGQPLRARPTPRLEFGSLHETLIIAGVTTVLVIRTQLWLLLVAVLVTQVFSFVESQFAAVFGLAIDLLLLVALRAVQANDPATRVAAVPGPRDVTRALRPASARL